MDGTGNRTTDIRRALLPVAGLCAGGILIDLLGAGIATALGLPLYLDSIGTVLAAALGGTLPGIAVGYLANLINSFADPTNGYYATINALIAVSAAWCARRGWMRRPSRMPLIVAVFALIGGGLGSVLTWYLYGTEPSGITAPLVLYIRETASVAPFLAQISADMLVDLADKAVVVLISALALVPLSRLGPFHVEGWSQAPLSEEVREAVRHVRCRSLSLRRKILILLGVASTALAVAAIVISSLLYHEVTIDEHIKLGEGVAHLAATIIDPARVEAYLEEGEAAEGYLEIEERLASVLASSPDIEYVYAYRILPDGCHVVFDIDTPEEEGADPGEVIPFDPSFLPYLPALLAGEPIDPIISDDSYGWLLTVYEPVYDEDGACLCYAAADISMHQVAAIERGFLARMVSLFLGASILILNVGVWMVEQGVILPVDTIAYAARTYAADSEEARSHALRRLRDLDIRTGDEIEVLYQAFLGTTADITRYIADIQAKSEVIAKMQRGLILVLADMVESRDQNTGHHVRRTAAYVKIIIAKMKEEGIYADALTDEFVKEVEEFAPLHDVGKIRVPDAILNKPGRLTDEEFAQMKGHTTAGREIIGHTMELVPEAGYLEEAQDLAAYHHERWDGRGYPEGLAGEAIPLSARIMAVADVFDALISSRSYKRGFPFEKAMAIIREGMGSHFDPQIAQAFLDAEEEVRRVSEELDE